MSNTINLISIEKLGGLSGATKLQFGSCVRNVLANPTRSHLCTVQDQRNQSYRRRSSAHLQTPGARKRSTGAWPPWQAGKNGTNPALRVRYNDQTVCCVPADDNMLAKRTNCASAREAPCRRRRPPSAIALNSARGRGETSLLTTINLPKTRSEFACYARVRLGLNGGWGSPEASWQLLYDGFMAASLRRVILTKHVEFLT